MPKPSAGSTRSGAPSRPRTAPRPRCIWCRTRHATSPGWRCRSTVGSWPDDRTPTLDRDRLRELFDLRSSYNAWAGGDLRGRSVSGVAPVARTGAGAARHPARADRLHGHDVLPRAALSRQPPFHGVRLRLLHDRLPQPGGIRFVPGARRSRERSTGSDQQHALDGRRAAQALPRPGPTVVPAGEWQVVDRQLDLPRPWTC